MLRRKSPIIGVGRVRRVEHFREAPSCILVAKPGMAESNARDRERMGEVAEIEGDPEASGKAQFTIGLFVKLSSGGGRIEWHGHLSDDNT
jgi:hypothetical protein